MPIVPSVGLFMRGRTPRFELRRLNLLLIPFLIVLLLLHIAAMTTRFWTFLPFVAAPPGRSFLFFLPLELRIALNTFALARFLTWPAPKLALFFLLMYLGMGNMWPGDLAVLAL